MRPSAWFRFCPRCGAPASSGSDGPPPAPRTAAVSAPEPFRCPSCRFTYYFNPTIAAAVFLRRPDGRMLFVRRAREPGKGLLAPPGGFIDIGERAEDALRREVREEVGLELSSPGFLASFPNEYVYREVTYPVLDFFFVADAVDPDRARALDDVEALCWRDPQAGITPEELAFPSMRLALGELRRRDGGSSVPPAVCQS